MFQQNAAFKTKGAAFVISQGHTNTCFMKLFWGKRIYANPVVHFILASTYLFFDVGIMHHDYKAAECPLEAFQWLPRRTNKPSRETS